MLFRLPTPLHGWRAFAGEVGVVVLGVLIALGANAIVDDWQWRDKISHAEAAMRLELAQDDGPQAYGRVVIGPCLDAELARILRRCRQCSAKAAAAMGTSLHAAISQLGQRGMEDRSRLGCRKSHGPGAIDSVVFAVPGRERPDRVLKAGKVFATDFVRAFPLAANHLPPICRRFGAKAGNCGRSTARCSGPPS